MNRTASMCRRSETTCVDMRQIACPDGTLITRLVATRHIDNRTITAGEPAATAATGAPQPHLGRLVDLYL